MSPWLHHALRMLLTPEYVVPACRDCRQGHLGTRKLHHCVGNALLLLLPVPFVISVLKPFARTTVSIRASRVLNDTGSESWGCRKRTKIDVVGTKQLFPPLARKRLTFWTNTKEDSDTGNWTPASSDLVVLGRTVWEREILATRPYRIWCKLKHYSQI
jgi:hypothetical protein